MSCSSGLSEWSDRDRALPHPRNIATAATLQRNDIATRKPPFLIAPALFVAMWQLLQVPGVVAVRINSECAVLGQGENTPGDTRITSKTIRIAHGIA